MSVWICQVGAPVGAIAVVPPPGEMLPGLSTPLKNLYQMPCAPPAVPPKGFKGVMKFACQLLKFVRHQQNRKEFRVEGEKMWFSPSVSHWLRLLPIVVNCG